MGLRLVTDEWVREQQRERDNALTALAKMEKEHDRALAWAREVRDTKDAEIDRLHAEIEALKNERGQMRTEAKRLRQAVRWYEEERHGKNKTAV